MPNLTAYRAPAIHLNREVPKTYCDLIEHEYNYIRSLRSRTANIRSALASTNQKHFNQDISHFRLRQKRWKEKIESENKRFIQSLVYHRAKYRPTHDRSTAQKSFEQHLKSLEMMSQYSKYNLTNSICRNLVNDMKFNNHSNKYREIKPNQYSRRTTPYLENILQQTINKAISIYNQPLPSRPSRTRTSYLEIDQQPKPSLYHKQKLFRSVYAVGSRGLGIQQTDD